MSDRLCHSQPFRLLSVVVAFVLVFPQGALAAAAAEAATASEMLA